MPDSGSPIEAPGIATITTPVLIKPDICSGEVVSAAGSTTFPVGGSSTETTLTSSSPTKHLRGPPFGVLKTGNLLKRNPNRPFDKPKRRFFILTSVALHWFKREDGYDLFGDERGNINLHDMSKVDLCAILPDNPSSHGDAFEVCCHQDSVHRIFQASSPEEARAWVSALKGAKKARPTFRRETLSGLSFSPHGHNYDKEPPLVSVVTLKKGEAGEEVVLAKAPQYQYGENFRLPLDPRASSPPPLSQTLCILLSNGDSAEVNTEVLRNCEVGDTLPARVSCLSDQIAVLPLTLRARFQAKTGAVPATPISRPEAFLVSSLSAVFLALSTGWSLQDGQGMAKGPGCFHYVERLLFLVLVAFTLLRALCPQLQVYLQKYNAWNGNHGYTTVLEISIDDYVVESRRSKNAEQEEANVLPPIPDRFVNGCFGDMVEAERRWRITLAWRKNFGTDTILEREHPYFDLVKQALPAFYCGTARDGNPVYYERSGQTDLAKAKEVGLDWMVYNYVHSTEVGLSGSHEQETSPIGRAPGAFSITHLFLLNNLSYRISLKLGCTSGGELTPSLFFRYLVRVQGVASARDCSHGHNLRRGGSVAGGHRWRSAGIYSKSYTCHAGKVQIAQRQRVTYSGLNP